MKSKGIVCVSILICIGVGYWIYSRSKSSAPDTVAAKRTNTVAFTQNVRDPGWEYKFEWRELPAAGMTALIAELKQEGWIVQSFGRPTKKEDGKVYSRVTLKKRKQ
jgi:hypothetical protein